MRLLCAAVMAVLLIVVPSCTTGIYVTKLAVGQARILRDSHPIGELRAAGELTPEEDEKLALIEDVAAYAQNRMGLKRDHSYNRLYRVKGDTLLYLVSACPKDELHPCTWWFPIIGKSEYKGFFKEGDALKEVRLLEDRGLDTCIQHVVAFSTLGWFNDPVYTTFLDLHPVHIIRTVIHEMVHNTLYVKDHTLFNEQLASFIAAKGVLTYVEDRHGLSSPWHTYAMDLMTDECLVRDVLDELCRELQRVYESGLSWGAVTENRNEVFARGQLFLSALQDTLRTNSFKGLGSISLNNAVILAHKRYLVPDEGVFEKLYLMVGRDLTAFMQVVTEIVERGGVPSEEIEVWLNAHPTGGD